MGWDLKLRERIQPMSQSRGALGLLIAGAMELHTSQVSAQEAGHSQEVQIYAGEIFGDRLTETAISGSTPRLNDADTIGFRYNYHYNERFGPQLQVGYSPRVTTGHVESGNTDGVIVGCDIDLVWNI